MFLGRDAVGAGDEVASHAVGQRLGESLHDVFMQSWEPSVEEGQAERPVQGVG